MTDLKFACDYAKLGTAGCKKCKQKLPKGGLRLAKVVTNPFSEDAGPMKQWYHLQCIFQTFEKARATTKIIDDVDDIDGYENLQQSDQDLIKEAIEDTQSKRSNAPKVVKKVQKTLDIPTTAGQKTVGATAVASNSKQSPKKDLPLVTLATDDDDQDVIAVDNAFRTYRKLCAEIAEEASYGGKTKIVSEFVRKGTSGDGFKGDLYLLIKLLLPRCDKRTYNLKDKQLVNHFSSVFGTDKDTMISDLEQGDVAETVSTFFQSSKKLKPLDKSTLSLQDVDTFLENLTTVTRDDEQIRELGKLTAKSTVNDIKMVVRLIKHDLRINAGAKHILDALDANAYEAFQASRDLHNVLTRVAPRLAPSPTGVKPGMVKALSVRASLLTPVLPMLAEPCRSFKQATTKCPAGMYVEIKYDGERVQVHKQGDQFEYFSRSLRPVQPHKVAHLKEYIPRAFPNANELIIDAEVLLLDTKTNKPLPFGTLGVHKRTAFTDATVCLFVFDCLHLNGQNLMNKPLKERRQLLEENMTEVKHRVLFSEKKFVNDWRDIQKMMTKVMAEGLEGLVLKDIKSIYEPGKRHWLKMKKDYLAEGAMADTADLIVLGAYYGTGNKGGLMSVFLMGCYDPRSKQFCTVTKCGNGHDDKTIDRLQKELQVDKISKDYNLVPSWLNIIRTLVPDFVVKDPKQAPVWEITGAEFSQSSSHTAGGISIRFPRVTKIRDDKTWQEATSVPELRKLYEVSKQRSDMDDKDDNEEEEESAPPAKKSKSNTASVDQAKHLSDLFSGMRVWLEPGVRSGDQGNKLSRYLIANDAEVLGDEQKSLATHRVLQSSATREPGVITADWVWRCIKARKLLPT